MTGRLLTEGLVSLAEKEATGPGGRERIAALLREVLASVERRPDAFVTAGTCLALDGIAEGLMQAAEAAAHVADHARVMLPPQRWRARR